MALPALIMTVRVPLFNAQYQKPNVWPFPVILLLSVDEQEGLHCCWAAVAVGLQRAYGDPHIEMQCDVETRVVGTPCCPDGDQPGCDTDQCLPPALAGHYDSLSRDMTWKTTQFVRDQIDAGRPIAVRVKWPQDTGHFVVISGYHDWNGNFELYICDPWTGLRTPWRYRNFLTSYENSGGVWDISYKTTGAAPVGKE